MMNSRVRARKIAAKAPPNGQLKGDVVLAPDRDEEGCEQGAMP